jgi:hypothetical protein
MTFAFFIGTIMLVAANTALLWRRLVPYKEAAN